MRKLQDKDLNPIYINVIANNCDYYYIIIIANIIIIVIIDTKIVLKRSKISNKN